MFFLSVQFTANSSYNQTFCLQQLSQIITMRMKSLSLLGLKDKSNFTLLYWSQDKVSLKNPLAKEGREMSSNSETNSAPRFSSPCDFYYLIKTSGLRRKLWLNLCCRKCFSLIFITEQFVTVGTNTCFSTETMVACQPAMKCSFLSTHPTHPDLVETSQKTFTPQGYKIITLS